MSHTISSVTPSSGRNDVNTAISILGAGLPVNPIVLIGSVSAENIIRVSSSLITCDVPDGIDPGIYDISVSDGLNDVYTLQFAFRVTLPLPDPPFSDQTSTVLVSRMLSNMPGNWDKRDGSWVRDIINAFSLDLTRLYQNANTLLEHIYAQFTFGQYLDLRAEEFGIIRNAATKSTGQVTVTGVNNTVIPIGTKFATTVSLNSSDPSIEFITTASAIIVGGTANIAIIAVEAGISGNVSAGKIDRIVTGITGLLTVTNANDLTNGTDKENDADFRERFLRQVRNPIAGGNKDDYVTWALEVDGIGGALCLPLWNGPGTVKVLIVDTNGDPANGSLITLVQNYISPTPGTGEGKAPIGASVTVVAPNTVEIDVDVTIILDPGYGSGAVITAVEDNLTAFIKALAIGDDVLYSAIADIIFDTEGVYDYSGLLVNAGTTNIIINSSEKAIVGTLNVSV